MPRPVSRGVAGALGGRVLVCGGRGEGAGHLAACHHLHLASSTWGRGPGLARGREDAASAVLGGLMVVTGGWDGARLLDSVEVFSSEAEQWQEVGSKSPCDPIIMIISPRHHETISQSKMSLLSSHTSKLIILGSTRFAGTS